MACSASSLFSSQSGFGHLSSSTSSHAGAFNNTDSRSPSMDTPWVSKSAEFLIHLTFLH